MSVPRTHDSSCDITVQPTVSTLHIPASHAFIPFQQFSISDGTGLRNPADDNNNKTALPVVSVVAAVSSLCPAIPVVSMQQSAQLGQVVASTIIPTVVTPMTVQTASCLPPTATMTVANTLNLGGHISLPLQQQQQQTIGIPGIALNSQVSGTVINPTNDTFNSNGTNQNTPLPPGNKPSNNSSNSPPSNNSSITSIKPNTSKSSNQSSNPEQNEDLVKPVFKDGELVLEVECGQNKAILYLSKLCQGSKGPCISFQSSWLTPNEFQFVSGRETAKDWKRSIRHHGKSLKLLLAKGILNVHPTMCDCDGCRQGATLTRKGEKRRIPNGERKPRKPTSNQNHGGGSGDGSSAGAFRPLTNPNMAAQLTSHGSSQAKQAKPEVKRSSGDKTKMADVTHQSLPKETSAGISTKQGLCTKTVSVQRPNSLVAATVSEQQGTSRASSAPSSPIKSPAMVSAVAAVATPSAHIHSNLSATSPVSANLTAPPTMSVQIHLAPPTVPVQTRLSAPPTMPVQSHLSALPTIPSQTHLPATLISPLQPEKSSPPTGLMHQTDSAAIPAGLVQIVKMSSAPATLALAQPFPTAASTASSPNTPTQSIPGHITALSLQSLPATVSFSKQQTEYLASTPNVSSARLPCNISLQPHTVSTGCVPPISSDDPRDENKHKSSEEEEEEENFTGNESDESQNVDEKSDDMDDESDDEQSDDCSMASENSISSDQMEDAACRDVDAQEASVPEVTEEQNKFDSIEDVKEHQDHETDTSNLNKSTEHANSSEEAALDQIKEDKQSFLLEPTSAASPSPAVTTTTLTLTGFSSTCSQPLSASISTTNIKSEQIWVPPTLSPPADSHYINRVKHINSSVKHSQDVTDNHVRGTDHSSSTPNKDFDRKNSARKPDRPAQPKGSSASGVKPDASFHGFSQSRDVHNSHLSQNSHTQRDPMKQDLKESDAKPGCVDQSSNSEKNGRVEEGEERYKQKVKEERNRKEREERNRKDREREERREKERREEKETERRRLEEKERREYAKVQIEGNSSKEMSAPSNSNDPSRRPPGGVAEAAAFSDYMRVLAAGHGHTFIPPALSYMPSFFPVRSQESSLPNHVHPMSAFGHQISGVPKDPIIYQAPGGVLSNYAASHFGHLHPLLQRSPYTTQQSLLDYQRSLTAVSSYPWPTAYPYFLPDVAATSSSSAASTSAAATLAVGAKRPTTEMEAALELSAKRMRLEGRPSEYSSPWDYFAAAALASQNQRLASLATSLPCGMESASVDKTWEYLRKRYLEYSPQTAAAYMSALPEYTRPMYYCACADHREDNIRFWNVEDVCKFLNSLDGCSVYADHFREQRVTGRILALLSTDHLVKSLGMKLGPAVLLAEAVAKKLQESSKISNCEACRNMALSQPMYPMAMPL